MALNLIRNRLARALILHGEKSKYAQRRNPDRKRKASFTRGSSKLTVHLSFLCAPEQAIRLLALCEKYKVQKGVVIRDALDFYLGIAEGEYEDVGPLTGLDAIPPKLAPDKVRRPDGAIVNRFDADPTRKGL